MRRHSAHARRVGKEVGRNPQQPPATPDDSHAQVVGDELKPLSDPESCRKWLCVVADGTEVESCARYFSLACGREWRRVVHQHYLKAHNATVSVTCDAARH